MNKILSFIAKYFTLIPVQYRFIAWVVLAFSSFIAFANIDSYTADKVGANGWLWVYGILSGLLTLAIAKIALDENKQ